jgi:hypothetical protein
MSIINFLNSNSGLVNAIATIILALITLGYLIVTCQIRNESEKYRETFEKEAEKSRMELDNQIRTEQKNIASALLNQINISEEGINNFNKHPEEPFLLVPNEIVYSTDMYFNYEKDITGFNPNLAKNLYLYHRYLRGAEVCRISANLFYEKMTNLKNQKLSQSQQELLNFYTQGLIANSQSMMYCMNQVGLLLPILKEDLNYEIIK